MSRQIGRYMKVTGAVLFFALMMGRGNSAEKATSVPSVASLRALVNKLEPLQKALAKPEASDWLACYKEEGQSFDQYLKVDPVNAKGKRNIIYIQKLGDSSEAQNKVLALTVDFLSCFFALEVKELPALKGAVIPADERRESRGYGEQFRSGYIIDKILKPKLPDDAIALVALCANDLYPEESWNFVFGEASLREHVGVWSIVRFGDPSKSEMLFQQCLQLTTKLASHEIGHMFTIDHCTAHECGMCGSNSLEESNRHPLTFCNECVAKVCYATKADPVTRYAKLMEFCRKHNLKAEADFYAKCIAALK